MSRPIDVQLELMMPQLEAQQIATRRNFHRRNASSSDSERKDAQRRLDDSFREYRRTVREQRFLQRRRRELGGRF